MSDTIISVENLSKVYRLAHEGQRPASFRELVTSTLTAPIRRLKSLSGGPSAETEDFWALKDVSFQVKRGEVVGIIGRNGAGKSTLLKVLSRIVEPTSGRIRMTGRVASLLEVGTGFHPELTGRENIYMNGAILGMKRREIRAKFDEIVAFAEVEKFLDTPVKRYSSGMYVRLAFAVAAHLDPEILIVDEVLAVGDAEFQKKCVGKMQQVATAAGRTVLFVSHNMTAVRSLCSQGVVLAKGHLQQSGPISACIDSYSLTTSTPATNDASFTPPPNCLMWVHRATLEGQKGRGRQIPLGDHLTLTVHFRSHIAVRTPRLGFVIHGAAGERLVGANNRYAPSRSLESPSTEGSITCNIGSLPLVAGHYTVSLFFGDMESDHHIIQDCLSFDVIERDLWGSGKQPPSNVPIWWPCTFECKAT